MTNYNYYNNLANRLKKNSSIEQKDKTHKPAFDKSVYEGYNGEKTKSYTPAYEYKPGYGNTQNRWLETNSHRGDNSLYKPKISEKEKPIYKKAGFQENNLIKDGFNVSNPSFKDDPWFEITPPSTTYDPGFLISDNPENPWDNTFKKKAQNQWYNKIAHGSFKDDDWFNSMVKNQEKAENWYKTTYGKKEGKKEYNALHNRLVSTPFDKIKEEEQQFVSYKASDFKVPELQPVKYSYNGGSKGEQNREKTGCYKKGDENLPFLTNYIINGNDGKTGGLNKVWQNASSAEERARIEKVAEMLRAEETDYDIGKIDSVIILRAIDGAMFAGHTALIIKNSDGQGVYFSFAEVNNEMLGKGEMSVDVLNKQQMDSFFKSGEMNYICNSTGTIESQKYSSYAEIPISKEQGASMIGKGIGYFHNPGRYALIGKQCDVVVQNILNQGDVDYKSKIFPNKSFSDYRDINELDEKTIKSLGEVVLDKIPSNVRNSIKGWFE